jgi:hypothetical protein
MTRRNMQTLLIAVAIASLSGCAAYRTSSNIEGGNQISPTSKRIAIYEGSTDPGKKYRTTQRIEVSIKKLTLFHSDPTKDQANIELEKRATALGCDAVTNVQYQTGIGLTTWGYIDAQGNCAKFD